LTSSFTWQPSQSFRDPPEVVIGENTQSSFNVFEAAWRNGIPRVIYGCSDSSTGFGIHNAVLRPHYIPIDEEASALAARML